MSVQDHSSSRAYTKIFKVGLVSKLPEDLFGFATRRGKILLTDPVDNTTHLWNLFVNNSTVDVVVSPCFEPVRIH